MEAKSGSDESEFHRDDILSLDLSADRKTVITGQSGKAPSVHVWSVEDQKQICSFLLEKGSRGVSAVSLSPCGRYVACVDMHNDHRITIYNIERKKQLLHTEGSKDKIFDIAWSKRPEDLRFATISAKEIKFWHPADVTKRLNQKGTFGKATMTNFSSLAFDEEGWCYTGGENGFI
jgi:WD40 repeat protein